MVMAPPQLIFSIFFLTLVFFSSLCNSRPLITHSHSHAASSSSNLNQFEGYRKGHQGLLPIKTYLHRYGYLDSLDHLDHVQMFDDKLESAILTYQQNFHLNTTGILDSETLAMMMAPRCGFPDIINGTNTMARRHRSANSSSFDTSLYDVFLPHGKWKKRNLKVVITDTFTPEQDVMVLQGLLEWHNKIKFSFTILRRPPRYYPDHDVHFELLRGDHGDGLPFDGPGGKLAHAFGPNDGRIHLDKDDAWTDGAKEDMYDMVSVAVHEMGHVLGLGHTDVEDAVMWPAMESDTVKRVPQKDDLDGIQALYPGSVR